VALNDLLFKALDHAVDSVSTGEDLIPFILTETTYGQRTLRRFQSDRLEWSVEQAKVAAANLSGEVVRYAVAYDAYVTVAGERFDTVVVEAGERGAGPGWSLGQRYRKASSGQQFAIVGNPLHLGNVEDRFEHSA
jgi:hypothetical protein